MSNGVTLILNCLRSGGAEKQLLWIAAELSSLDIPCSIVELVAGERTERIEAMVRHAQGRGVRFLRATSDGGILRGLWRLRQHLHQAKPFLIWSWGLRADCTALLGRWTGYYGRWLVSIRCVNKPGRGLTSWIQALVARFSDGVISNTHAALRMSEFGELPSSRLFVLPNAARVDTRREVVLPDMPPDRLVLVMLGNIKMQHKGYDLAARCAQRLKANGMQFELRIAGRPDELSELDTVVQELGIESVVKFYGEVSQPEEFLRGGHLYLLLSRFEGMPNTLLEALSCGLPAIATDVGDLRALKEKGAPFVLIPTEDVEAAVAAVASAWGNWGETRALAAQGRGWVQSHFSEESCRAVLKGILAELTK